MEGLFRQFDSHLARQGYIARGGQIRDASIVPVPRNHNTRDENAAIKKGETPEDRASISSAQASDMDARWTKKHAKSHYGSKIHINVDRKHNLMRGMQPFGPRRWRPAAKEGEAKGRTI